MTAPEPVGVAWRKSSYRAESGGCVEVGWPTSSSYRANGGACLKVAPAPARVLVRDSKDPDGPALAVPAGTWWAFLPSATR
jgi:Domain of unknown function (DUF397)